LTKLFFVIPALDERANLPALSERLRAAAAACERPSTLILVDDGSTDGTGDAAPASFAPLPCRVVKHPTNLGVAAAFRTGFAAALEQATDDDLVVTLEADNTSDIGRLPDLVRIAEGGTDLVLGSCYAPGGGVEGTGLYRHVLSGGANTMIKAWFGLWGLHTFSSFYRVYRAQALREVFAASGGDPLSEGGFSSVVELLVRMHAMGHGIEEVAVVLRSSQRQGKSKMRVMRTIGGYFRVMGMLGPFACRFRGKKRD
jgi:dolichol-phosphate mannosyltransferase